MSTPFSRADGKEELPMDVDDYINAKIYSMLGDCTEDSLRRYELELAQKSVVRLQQEVRELKCKLQAQAARYDKAKAEASMNATALKTSIANCQSLTEELKKWMEKGMLWKSCPEQRGEASNVTQVERLGNTDGQHGGLSSSDQTMDAYGGGNMIPKEQAVITSDGLEVRPSTDSIYYCSAKTAKVNRKDGPAKFLQSMKEYLSKQLDEQNSNQTDKRHRTRKKPLRVLDLNAEDSKYRTKIPVPSNNCLQGLEIERKKVVLANSKVEISQREDQKVETQDSVISVKDQNYP